MPTTILFKRLSLAPSKGLLMRAKASSMSCSVTTTGVSSSSSCTCERFLPASPRMAAELEELAPLSAATEPEEELEAAPKGAWAWAEDDEWCWPGPLSPPSWLGELVLEPPPPPPLSPAEAAFECWPAATASAVELLAEDDEEEEEDTAGFHLLAGMACVMRREVKRAEKGWKSSFWPSSIMRSPSSITLSRFKFTPRNTHALARAEASQKAPKSSVGGGLKGEGRVRLSLKRAAA